MECTQLGYLGTDQYGNHYNMSDHPRKELMQKLGAKSASKMYVDTTDGKVRHVGYIIKGRWVNVYRVCQWKSVE